jgi:hypothetical protein
MLGRHLFKHLPATVRQLDYQLSSHADHLATPLSPALCRWCEPSHPRAVSSFWRYAVMPLNQAFAADAVTNPGGIHLDCAALPPAEAELPAHSDPLGMSFLEGSAAIGGGEDLAPAVLILQRHLHGWISGVAPWMGP